MIWRFFQDVLAILKSKDLSDGHADILGPAAIESGAMGPDPYER